ncbi:alpha-1,2-fucosyltransferase [Pedobacter sandarakinus]|uniref:alpha-1,2-fucosyltransferase n=1 Tax=Pedobacter sandarakinus TaxID=353156 RepID=UPI0022472A84|nr:alpha-1,2-fucosyltransferase [Pedobacter sandarakinus]MCX2575931.1 alpha-1,2-fucosyltransferase [Pedobacter sandarakinus]
MVIVKLQGGLGNQMFQYATAKAIADNRLYLDNDFLNEHRFSNDQFTGRKFELSIFKNITFKMPNQISKYFTKMGIRYFSKYIYQSENNEFIDFKAIKEANLYLDGYFQNENYFSSIRTRLLAEFKFPTMSAINDVIAKEIYQDPHAVSVHVRRGDYLKPAIQAFHGILALEYYYQAKNEIEKAINSPNYYIFSDDIDWCRENLRFPGAKFVSNLSSAGWEDMYLMSCCKHNIVANSSYSWWGAWLNTNETKIVVAPKKWFVQTETDIVPNQWIKV